jgi:hypothetical protein
MWLYAVAGLGLLGGGYIISEQAKDLAKLGIVLGAGYLIYKKVK